MIYGNFEVGSPVLCELILSAPLQRMKGIAQLGLPDEYFHTKGFNRFEHCVGVMLLLKKLGASEEEQVAGLLHDVSHTAFSHVIDWVVGTGETEDYQDLTHADYIKRTVIPDILARHGFDVDRICDYHNFGLLERKAPDLCADRADYTFREMGSGRDMGILDDLIGNLIIQDGRIIFCSQTQALIFARHYLNLQIDNWGGFESYNYYRVMAAALKRAIKIGALVFDDLWQDDQHCLDKLIASGDEEILRLLAMLRHGTLRGLPVTGERVPKKFRCVDPLYFVDGRLERLSEHHQEFKKELESARAENALGVEMVAL